MATLIIPEVFADAVNAKLDSALRIGRVAFDATPTVPEAMQYGDTVHFPKLKRVVTASEVTKGTAISPSAVDMADMSATIKQVGGAARVYDSEAAQIKGLGGKDNCAIIKLYEDIAGVEVRHVNK